MLEREMKAFEKDNEKCLCRSAFRKLTVKYAEHSAVTVGCKI